MKRQFIITSLVFTASLFFPFCKKEPVQNIHANKFQLGKDAVLMSSTTVIAPPFIFGVNGHPTNKAYLGTTAKQQFDLIRSMGMNYYRLDFVPDANGSINGVSGIINPFFAELSSGTVKILPCIYTRYLDFSMTPQQAYYTGKALAGGFAQKYGQYFDYYELGNELDNKAILAGKNGNLTSEYDAIKLNVISGYLKGMISGIKGYDPDAKTVVNGSWIHFGFLRAMLDRNVNFDVTGWHWYSDMETNAPQSVCRVSNIGQMLGLMFNKPVWFTEINTKNGTQIKTEEEQRIWLNNFKAKCKATPGVKGVLVYELFDEPEHSVLVEKKYGINKWATIYSGWKFKTAASNFFTTR